jgi:glycosyltransferase involved in cell wall biosynthesis
MGPGLPDYVERLFDLARREGCSDRLELHKQVPPAEVVAALAGAGVGLALFQPVCLSHRLVAPNKLFEYMVAGVPTLASDLPVIEAFVARHGVGMTVAATDVASIADAMCAMLEPERNRELRAATAIAAREVTWAAERAVLLGAYEHAVRAATPL